MADLARFLRPAAAAAVTAVILTSCGSSDTKDSSDSGTDTDSNASKPEAAALVKKANTAMKTTTFQSSGSTTAFEGGKQVTTWDPDKGLRMKVTGGEAEGESYCKDGTNYISAALLSASLKQSGEGEANVPDALSDTYVYTKTGQTCDAFFRIADTAELMPEKDGKVDGKDVTAVAVSNGQTSDVYYIAASGKPYVLKLESERGGKKSTTTYSAFGKKTDVTLPSEEDTIALEDFQEKALKQ